MKPFLNANGADEQFHVLLQVANPDIKVVVPKKRIKKYQKIWTKWMGELQIWNGDPQRVSIGSELKEIGKRSIIIEKSLA